MKINKKSIAIAIVTLIIFTILPLMAPEYLPSEVFTYLSIQGIDILGLLTKIAMIGIGMTVLILLKGFMEKTSSSYLGLSIVSNLYWLFIAIFVLSFGKIENFGIAIISATGGEASNIIIFDLRLFVGLTALIIALKITHSVIKFQENKLQIKSEPPKADSNLPVPAEINSKSSS